MPKFLIGKILVVLKPPGTDDASKKTEKPLLVPKHKYYHRWKRLSELMMATDTEQLKAALAGGRDRIKPALHIH